VLGRIAAIRTAGNHFHRWQQIGEGADRRALGSTAMARDQNAADGRIDHAEQYSEFQIFLPDDGCERKSLLQSAPETGGW